MTKPGKPNSFDLLKAMLSQVEIRIPTSTPTLHTAVYQLKKKDGIFPDLLFERGSWFPYSPSLAHSFISLEMAGLLEPVGINQEEYIITEKLRQWKNESISTHEATEMAEKFIERLEDNEEK
jgi:hypothetical protein